MAKNLVSYVLVGKRIPGFKQKLAVLGNLNYHTADIQADWTMSLRSCANFVRLFRYFFLVEYVGQEKIF